MECVFCAFLIHTNTVSYDSKVQQVKSDINPSVLVPRLWNQLPEGSLFSICFQSKFEDTSVSFGLWGGKYLLGTP